jgi:hypothetical protein
MESLINRAIYHPLVSRPMFYLADLMCTLDCSLAAAALVMASTFAIHLSRIFKTRLRRNKRRERCINA